ncbi:MAG: hypothetical protein F6K07_32300, partial [Okeania sp. SIO1H5]|uniref:hypothetical protein n=1 Tax=Okeania sp. SIO1H5 TaxID=2607777 RepID=UPI0013BB6DDD
MWHVSICKPAIFVLLVLTKGVLSIDKIPEDMSQWTERGAVIKYGTGWEEKKTGDFRPEGFGKKDGKYYLYYGAGFDGCWQNDDKVSHKSIGLAVSDDAINFSKYPQNPILKPHDFVPVTSHEEAIRGAIIKFEPG